MMGVSTTFSTVTLLLLYHNAESTLTFVTNGTSDTMLVPLIAENRTQTLELDRNLGFQSLGCLTNDTVAPLTKNGIKDISKRWRNFCVSIDTGYTGAELTLINNAMYSLALLLPCVNFQFFTGVRGPCPYADYVHITNGYGCWSYIGRIGGRQEMSLHRSRCMTTGVILHQMMHALGFFHEHVRPDRDDYITIIEENIRPGHEYNFQKTSYGQVSTYGMPYNQRSIMHYAGNAFGIDGRTTIKAKNNGVVGSTGDLQETDKELLRRMYQCGHY